MKLKEENYYSKILELIYQLSDKEIEELTQFLISEINSKKTSSSTDLQGKLKRAPTWEESEFSEYLKAREHLNKSRIA
jgi:hypothetical protein